MKKLITTITFLSLISSKSALANKSPYDIENIDNLDQNIECSDLKDPFEKVNRKIFIANSFLDYVFLKPVAQAYMIGVNPYAKERISNFLSNSNEPLSTFNYGLQFDAENSFKSFWRFFVNTFFGFGGAYDVASKFDLNPPQQSFGSTMAYYGASPGPYVVLPFFGGSSMRDMWDKPIFDSGMNIAKMHLGTFQNSYTMTSMVASRADLIPVTDALMKSSTDIYVSLRSVYHQNREKNLRYPDGYICGVKNKNNVIIHKKKDKNISE